MRETYRIPMEKIKEINRHTDHLFQEFIHNIVAHGIVFHDDKSDVDYVVEEVRIFNAPITLERVVEFDIKIVEIYGDYKEVERPTLMQYLGVEE